MWNNLNFCCNLNFSCLGQIGMFEGARFWSPLTYFQGHLSTPHPGQLIVQTWTPRQQVVFATSLRRLQSRRRRCKPVFVILNPPRPDTGFGIGRKCVNTMPSFDLTILHQICRPSTCLTWRRGRYLKTPPSTTLQILGGWPANIRRA